MKLKYCGLTRKEDIEAVNGLAVDYAGFVFAPESRRYVPPEKAKELRRLLNPRIRAVGVFTDAPPDAIAELAAEGVIDVVQLHGCQTNEDIARVRNLTDAPIIRAYRVRGPEDIQAARTSAADIVMLDAGAGEGRAFDWRLIAGFDRPYFLAGGLTVENFSQALELLKDNPPFALDLSSGLETKGLKDKNKMAAFAAAFEKTTKKTEAQ